LEESIPARARSQPRWAATEDESSDGHHNPPATLLIVWAFSRSGVEVEIDNIAARGERPQSPWNAFIDGIYNNMFNRSGDASGLAYWTGQVKQTMQAGRFVGSVLIDIMSGAQDSAAGMDITTLMGKVAAGLAYVQAQAEHQMAWAGASDIAAATALLDPVTADARTVLTGIKNAEVLVAEHA
jgi:hypothetical protein